MRNNSDEKCERNTKHKRWSRPDFIEELFEIAHSKQGTGDAWEDGLGKRKRPVKPGWWILHHLASALRKEQRQNYQVDTWGLRCQHQNVSLLVLQRSLNAVIFQHASRAQALCKSFSIMRLAAWEMRLGFHGSTNDLTTGTLIKSWTICYDMLDCGPSVSLVSCSWAYSSSPCSKRPHESVSFATWWLPWLDNIEPRAEHDDQWESKCKTMFLLMMFGTSFGLESTLCGWHHVRFPQPKWWRGHSSELLPVADMRWEQFKTRTIK